MQLGKRPALAFIFVYLGGGEMRMTILTILTCILGLFAYAPTTEAAPNCPPQYQEICKQLITALDDNNTGQFYTWDGTHLKVEGNFLMYSSINNSKTDNRDFGLPSTADELLLS
jgi:hypothetical protein